MVPRRRQSKPPVRDLNPLVQAADARVAVEAPDLPPARRAKVEEALAPLLSQLSRLVGLRRLVIRAANLRLAPVEQVLRVLEDLARQAAQGEAPPPRTETAHGARWRWTRHQQSQVAVFVERLVLTDESDASPAWDEGRLSLPLQALPLAPERLAALLASADRSGGLAVNWVTWRPSRSDRLAPLPVQAIDDEARPTFSGDARAMTQIANAFWQPQWAIGSTRVARGKTFPAALLPIRRDPLGPLDDSALETPTGVILGETSVTNAILQRMASAGRLLFDPATQQFSFTSDKGVGERERRALDRLNRLGFFDRFVADPPRRALQVARVIPFQGVAPLSDVFTDWPRFGGAASRPLAGINSSFFLNFPEEYQSPHSALNDPVSTLVLDSVWHAPPLFRRAALLISAQGRVEIRAISWEDVVIETPLLPKPVVPAGGVRASGIPASVNSATCPRGGVQVFTPWAVRETTDGALRLASFRPGRDRAFLIVGCEVVEEFRTREITVPHNGWVLMVPGNRCEAPTPLLGAMRRVAYRWRRPADRKVLHAMAGCPLLLSQGRPLTANDLARSTESGLPEELCARRGRRQGPERRGVPPVRFPFDADQTRAPRTAIGLTGKREVVLAVVDGRTDRRHSAGATLREMAILMRDLGCREALNLDGGGSAMLFLDHPAVRNHPLVPNLPPGIANRPSDRGGVERVVPLPLLLWAK
jgi:hypothetical protein